MNRRDFLKGCIAAGVVAVLPAVTVAKGIARVKSKPAVYTEISPHEIDVDSPITVTIEGGAADGMYTGHQIHQLIAEIDSGIKFT